MVFFSYANIGGYMAKKIVIDPGHGGVDSGAVSNNVKEKDLTLMISKYMYDRFKELGVPVSITRDSDITLSPDVRPREILNKYGNGSDVIVISNHINAGGGEGAEVIYALRNNGMLANMILKALEDAGQKGRKVYQKRLPSNSSKDYYYIMRNTPNNETLIVEYGFIDNAKDLVKIQSNYKDYAEAVIKAVCEYAGYKYVPLNNNIGTYVVKKGDTLYSISKKFNLSVDELKMINNLTSNNISIGEVLKVSNDSNNNVYMVKKGDTLYGISKMFNTSIDELKKLNNLESDILSIGSSLLIPIMGEGNIDKVVHKVVKGDTLWSIARKYSTTVSAIKSLNNLTSNLLSIGDELIVPR